MNLSSIRAFLTGRVTANSQGQSLFRKCIIYGMGVAGGKGILLLLLPLLTFFMSKEEVGLYDVILTTVALVCPILTLCIEQGVLRWLLSEQDVKFETVISTALRTVLLNTLLYTSLYWIGIIFVPFSHAGLLYLLVIGNSLFYIAQNTLRGMHKSFAYAALNIANPLIFSILAYVFLRLQMGIGGVLVAQFIGVFVSIVFVAIKSRIWHRVSLKYYDRNLKNALLRYSVPLLPNYFAWWGINSVNKYLVFIAIGPAAAGIYAIAQRLSSVLLMIDSAFYGAWTEESFLKYKAADRDHYFSSVFDRYSTLYLTGIIVFTGVSRHLVALITSSSFHEAWRYIPALFLGVAFNSFAAFFGTVYLCERDTVGIVRTSLTGAVVTVSLGILLFSPLGLYGIALATVVGSFCVFVLRLVRIRRILSLRIRHFKLGFLLAVFGVAYALALQGNGWADVVLFGTSLGLAVFLNLRLFRKILC